LYLKFSQFGAKICLLTSFKDTCLIEIVPRDLTPTKGKSLDTLLLSYQMFCSIYQTSLAPAWQHLFCSWDNAAFNYCNMQTTTVYLGSAGIITKLPSNPSAGMHFCRALVKLLVWSTLQFLVWNRWQVFCTDLVNCQCAFTNFHD